jgi:hypothetical protein
MSTAVPAAQMEGGEEGSCGVSANEYSCTRSPNGGGGGGELQGKSKWETFYTGAQKKFGDINPYLTYADVYKKIF